jgi:hypothetical protein
MTRRPSRAAIAAEDAAMIERQRRYRLAADWMTERLAREPAVVKVALIGSVARPLWREVPRLSPFRQLAVPIVHHCNDLDLAVWVSDLDGLDCLRRDRVKVTNRALAEINVGVPVHEIELFVLEPESDRYLGRVCYFKTCPADKRDCLVAGCGAYPFLKQREDFTFWPETLDPSRMVILFDRAVGVVGSAAALPSVVDASPRMIEVTVAIPEHRRGELDHLVQRWRTDDKRA